MHAPPRNARVSHRAPRRAPLGATVFPLLLLLALPGRPAFAQGIAYAPDGRLAASIHGHLWLRAASPDSAPWVQLTSGTAWDRDPAWTPDGTAIVYASVQKGTSALWRLPVGAAPGAGAAPSPARAAARPVRLSASTAWEAEPAVGPDGTIYFVRGRGPEARIWARAPGGAERRVGGAPAGAGRWPALSPDGRRLAYVAVVEHEPSLHVRLLAGDSGLAGDSDRVLSRAPAERPVWSPDGQRIAFATRGGAGGAGVWVTDLDGRYTNLASTHAAEPAWSPDGRSLALLELGGADPGYNGDPDRLGTREVGGAVPLFDARVWRVAAPTTPDAQIAALPEPSAAERQTANAAEFDRITQRLTRLYFADSSAPRGRAWSALVDRWRPRALAAGSDSAFRDAVHRMLRERPTLREPATGQAAVSSAHPVATAAGLEVLREGGNVVDAAVAVSFALGVVEPDASGPGGYGQMLVYTPGMARPTLIEFMTRAPEEASLANGALLENGEYPDDGPVLANVPGTVAAMWLAWRKYGSGKLPWARLLAPAIRAAKQGYVVSQALATTLSTEREHFKKYPGSRALFFRDGEPLHAGDTLRNPDLAWTLEQIAAGGADAFYKGEVARRIVADLRGHGNAMRLTDLARYYAAEREPVSGTYRGYTLYSSAPPSGGGATLVAQLNALEQVVAPRSFTEDAATLHAMIEAWKLVPSQRGRIADPGLWPVQLETFTSKDSARARWACFQPQRSLTPADLRGRMHCGGADTGTSRADSSARPPRRTGTSSFTVADGDGNVVQATQTLGTWGGSFYVTPGLGFVYNDKLTSYGNDPDAYGARLPDARHGSSIAPTIVFGGSGSARRPLFATGAAGNAWITSAVYAVVAGVIDDTLPIQRAIELPRFLIGQRRGSTGSGYLIQMEDGFAPAVYRALERMGDQVQLISAPGELRMGYGSAIALGRNSVTAAADPRREGAAGAVACRERKGMTCR